MSNVTRLNLGCGDDARLGWINHDRWGHSPDVDVVHDLNELPWPWRDDSVDKIAAVSVLEHLRIDLVEAMDEMWRILKPDGLMKAKHPVVTSPFINDDPTHRWRWTEKVWTFFDPTTKYGQEHGYYTGRKWRIVALKVGPKKRNCWVTMEPIK